MIEKYEVDGLFDKQKEKHTKLKEKLVTFEADINKVRTLKHDLQSQIDTIYMRQREVVIGKRNVNCLVCSEEPVNSAVIGKNGKVY
jgi:hypothetical protein